MLKFLAGQWQKPVAFTVFPDASPEPNDTIVVTLSNPTTGLVIERSQGTLTILAPGETREYDLTIGALEGAAALDAFAERVRGIAPMPEADIPTPTEHWGAHG